MARSNRDAEVEALMRLHGWSLDDSAELVGIDPARYTQFKGRLPHLPTPEDLEQITLAIRDGQEYVSVTSYHRWKDFRELQIDKQDSVDVFDLGGRIADDDVELPSWLYSADREG